MGRLQNLKRWAVRVVPASWRPWIHERIHRESREIWILRLSEEEHQPLEIYAPIRFSFADERTLQEIVKDKGLELGVQSIPYYSALLRNGNRLIVDRDEDQIVFYGGIMVGRRCLPRGFFLLESDEFYIVACFTRADHRGRGIYPSAIRFACKHLAEEGYRQAYIDVATYNTPSVHGIMKAGAKQTNSGYQQIRFFGYEMSIPHGPLSVRVVNAIRPSLWGFRFSKGTCPDE